MKKWLAHCNALILALLALPAHAATITVDDTGAIPSTNVALQQLSTNDHWYDMRRTGATGTAWRDFAQTFTVVSSFTLDKISILVAQDPEYPALNQSLKINLFSTSDINTPSGTSLLGGGETGTTPSYTRNVDNGPDLGNPGDPNDVQNRRWMTFDIADVALTGGQVYGYRIGFNTQSSSSRLGGGAIDLGGIFADTSDPYAAGRAFRLDLGTNTPQTSITALTDFAFVLHEAVPEPSVLALALTGVFGIVGQIVWRRAR